MAQDSGKVGTANVSSALLVEPRGLRAHDGLVTTGPYRWLRHPIYTAICLFIWACFAGHTSLFALGMASLVTAGAVVRMLTEESLLSHRYPEYAEYARRTKRMVPYLF